MAQNAWLSAIPLYGAACRRIGKEKDSKLLRHSQIPRKVSKQRGKVVSRACQLSHLRETYFLR